jgi:uncharacterized protein (TIGR02001 family)
VLAALMITVGSTSIAQKKSSIPGNFSANVALTSEYLFRGLSQTDDAPAIQGGFDYEIQVGGPVALYLGTWASNVDFNEPGAVDGATVEIDLYGGLKGKVGRSGFSWEAGLVYYSYPGAASGLDYDYWEVQGQVWYDFGVLVAFGGLNYSTENFGDSGEAVYLKVGADFPIKSIKGLSLSGYIAQQYVEDNAAFGTEDYIEYNMGVTYNLAGLFDVSVNYSDTDISPDTEGKDEAIIVTVGRTF